MHWADINAAMTKAGWPPMKTARHLGVSAAAITYTTRGDNSSYNIASFISAKTAIPLSRLWPDGRYSQPSSRQLARAQRRAA